MSNSPPRGTSPDEGSVSFLKKHLPNLKDGEWSKTGNATGLVGSDAYNCYAWSLCRDDIGWIEQIVDALGNDNKIIDIEDFLFFLLFFDLVLFFGFMR